MHIHPVPCHQGPRGEQGDPQEPREGRVITYREFLDKRSSGFLVPLSRGQEGVSTTLTRRLSPGHISFPGTCVSPGPGDAPPCRPRDDTALGFSLGTRFSPLPWTLGRKKRNTEGSLSSKEKGEPPCSLQVSELPEMPGNQVSVLESLPGLFSSLSTEE